MSRSYRKPYAVFTGAHEDKKMAARGLRRRLKQWLHTAEDPEAVLISHRFECLHNNTYTWERDGRQFLVHTHVPCPEDGWVYRRWIKLYRK